MHGWIVLDKPADITSAQAIGKVRHLLRTLTGVKPKIGHAGTLDPFATGVLPLAINEATKAMPYALMADKAYDFSVTFGETRVGDDITGEVTATSDTIPSEKQIQAVLPQFVGEVAQVPPIFSAKKIDGKRAYDLARAGEQVTLKSSLIRIDRLVLNGQKEAETFDFSVACGKGTYVRALARDIAAALGTIAYVSALRRTQAGPFTLSHAISLEKLQEIVHKGGLGSVVLPIETVLDGIPVVSLTLEDARSLRQGKSIPLRVDTRNAKVFAKHSETPIAIARVSEGKLYPERVFNIA